MAIRAVVVEDSATQRAALVRALERDGDIAVVATAEDADTAVATVARHAPGVVTMDLEIPRGGGTEAIRRIMAEHPAPVLVLSGLIEHRDAAPAVEALAAGAIDAVPKPRAWDAAHGEDLRRRVRRVASVPVVRRRAARRARAGTGGGSPAPPSPRPRGRAEAAPASDGAGVAPGASRAAATPASAPVRGWKAGHPPVVGIAASTGGPAALACVLAGLHDLPAPVLVVQHIHESFVESLAAWLGRETGLATSVARHGERPCPGAIHLAPAGAHLALGAEGKLVLSPDPAGLLHRPSGDVLLQSLAERIGSTSIGVVLTGMGDDGARGLLAIREAGGTTLAQDAASCAVFGMPRAARDRGATSRLLAPEALATAIRSAVQEVAR